MDTDPHVLFAGGGSLGYLYPGLAIADVLRRRLPRLRVSFAGDGRPIERHTINSAGYAYASIPARYRPRSAWDRLRFVADNGAGFLASHWLLKEKGVSLVVGLGGHASTPLLRSAQSQGLPTVLLEPNVQPAAPTRRLAEAAEFVCLGFDHARQFLPSGVRTITTGVPGRPTICRLHAEAPPEVIPITQRRERRLVVLGGAGGARSINESMPVAASRLRDQLAGWRIVHQTGEGQLLETVRRYQAADVDAVVVTYIDELADLLRDADLVICRPGGCTLAEMALAGAPAVVVPDLNAAHGSQEANADVWRQAGACRLVNEAIRPLGDALAREVSPLLSYPRQLDTMARAARAAARPDAATQIAEACLAAMGVGAVAPAPLAAAA